MFNLYLRLPWLLIGLLSCTSFGIVFANHEVQSSTTTPSLSTTTTSSPYVSASTHEPTSPPVITHHQLQLAEGMMDYNATVGFMPIESNAVTFASIFYVSYVKGTAKDLGGSSPPTLYVPPMPPLTPRVILEPSPTVEAGVTIKPLASLVPGVAPETSQVTNSHNDTVVFPVPPINLASQTIAEHASSLPIASEQFEPPSERPVTFVFNGGPGSSSVILHMFALGPKRALLGDDGSSLPPPPQLVDNIYSWLEFTDLVFIDPVGTGFSAAMNPFPFYDVMNDAASVAEFVRRYLTENNRWLSPVFVVGESYGGIRGAVLSWRLMNDNDIALRLNGLLLVSPALDLDVTFPDAYKNLQLSLFMPTMAATAWFHRRLEPSLLADKAALLDEVETWSQEVYLPALLKGNHLTPEEMEEIAHQMSRYSSLSADFILDKRLRVMPEDFFAEFLRYKRLTLSRNDSRFDEHEVAASATILSPTWNYYVREELKYQGDEAYTLFSPEARLFWTWGDGEAAFSVLPMLSEVMMQNPHMKLFVASGYYDFTVPYYVIDYTLRQLQIDYRSLENITHVSYDGGHAVYTSKAELEQFTQDVKKFYEGAIGKGHR